MRGQSQMTSHDKGCDNVKKLIKDPLKMLISFFFHPYFLFFFVIPSYNGCLSHFLGCRLASVISQWLSPSDRL